MLYEKISVMEPHRRDGDSQSEEGIDSLSQGTKSLAVVKSNVYQLLSTVDETKRKDARRQPGEKNL